MPELRKDPTVGRWVIIATERVRRPHDFAVPRNARRGGPCPFCAGHERETPPEVLAYREPAGAPADAPGWRVRVVPNKFPALRVEGEIGRRGEGVYDVMSGIGAHEVVIESPDHDTPLGRLSPRAVEEVVRAYRDRIHDLRRDPRLRSAIVFKNHGMVAGASLEHPHSQIIATPIVPLAVADELHQARAYYEYRERCLYCDILHQETRVPARVVAETPHAVAFAPYAPRFPFETWVMPRRHAAAFDHATDAELAALAALLREVLGRLDRLVGDPPFNLILHTAPFGGEASPSYHWHVEILPTLTAAAGFEWGTGFHINPMPPEEAARLLRAAEWPA
jgi:UDPglucose--hexose-1-phosphate uridylyltransferase